MVEINSIPDAMFHEVLFVKEVCKATLLDKDMRDKMEIPHGGPDTVLVSMMGGKRLINRTELMETYKTIDNKQIKLSDWHYGKEKMVYKEMNIPMKMFTVPAKSKLKVGFNGKSIQNGLCIICKLNENKIDKDNIIVLSQDRFRKQFKITKVASKADMKKMAMSIKATKELNKQNTEKTSRWKKPVEQKQSNEKAIVSVVAALVNKQGKVIGYKVKHLKTNKIMDFATVKIMELCRNQKIKNMTIVAKDGKEFLRGVGMRKENLPRVLYQGNNRNTNSKS